MLKITLISILLFILPVAAQAQQSGDCVKQVLDHYCLGSRLEELLRYRPVKTPIREQGDRSGVIYQEDNEKIYVMAYKGIVYKVLRTYEPEARSTLRNLQRTLQGHYGDYQDLSHYPEDTKNKARQLSSIHRGDGELRYVWQASNEPWRVELGWSRRLGISVSYFLNALDEEQKAAALRGL